jgi:hypothetical protein
MYTDDVWGRSGPDAVINITEPVKSKRLLVVDEIKRALDIAEIVPFRYLIQHIGVSRRGVRRRAKWTRRFRRSKKSACSRASAAWKCCSKTRPTRLSSAERLLVFFEQTHLDLNVCLDVRATRT